MTLISLKKCYQNFLAFDVLKVQTIMFWSFWGSIVLFPLGYITREITPTICLFILLRYYKLNWKKTVLRNFNKKILFVFLLFGICVGVFFSTDPINSFFYVFKHINKGFVYPLVAMECVNSTERLEKITLAFVAVCFWQGCDGIYQSLHGYDFIDNMPIIKHAYLKHGRLTGSMNDYRVGNFMALTIIPASACYIVSRKRMGLFFSVLVQFITLFPGLYLLYFSYTRNAYFTLLAASILLAIVHCKFSLLRQLVFYFLIIIVFFIILLVIMPERIGFEAILHDGRWDLWWFAWHVFLQFPWVGAGFWQYNHAFRSLGFVPTLDPITISHPHNIYLQLLCESGVLGALSIGTFLAGFCLWGYRQVRSGLLRSIPKSRAQQHWILASFFWVAWTSYLLSGIAGHDFFRDWWFSQAMILFGILVGACSCPVTGQ